MFWPLAQLSIIMNVKAQLQLAKKARSWCWTDPMNQPKTFRCVYFNLCTLSVYDRTVGVLWNVIRLSHVVTESRMKTCFMQPEMNLRCWNAGTTPLNFNRTCFPDPHTHTQWQSSLYTRPLMSCYTDVVEGRGLNPPPTRKPFDLTVCQFKRDLPFNCSHPSPENTHFSSRPPFEMALPVYSLFSWWVRSIRWDRMGDAEEERCQGITTGGCCNSMGGYRFTHGNAIMQFGTISLL